MTRRSSSACPILSEVLEKGLLQGAEGTLERALCNVQKDHGAVLCTPLMRQTHLPGLDAFER